MSGASFPPVDLMDGFAAGGPAAGGRPLAEHCQGDKVEFCRLTKKFVDNAQSVPEDASDVLYYTMAVGHHTGVIDCFERVLEMPVEAFERIVAQVPDAEARYKLEGVLRFGEIEVDKGHVPLLLPALRSALSSLDVFNEPGKTTLPLSLEDTERLAAMIDLVLKVRSERHVYLMVRRCR